MRVRLSVFWIISAFALSARDSVESAWNDTVGQVSMPSMSWLGLDDVLAERL